MTFVSKFFCPKLILKIIFKALKLNLRQIETKRKEHYMNKQKLKGLWIPAEILLNEELTDKEKLILF